MKKILRFLLCFVLALITVYISGFGFILNNIEEAKALYMYFFNSFILSLVFTLILELFLYTKEKLKEINKVLLDLKSQVNENNHKDE